MDLKSYLFSRDYFYFRENYNFLPMKIGHKRQTNCNFFQLTIRVTHIPAKIKNVSSADGTINSTVWTKVCVEIF